MNVAITQARVRTFVPAQVQKNTCTGSYVKNCQDYILLLYQGRTNCITQFSTVICKNNVTLKDLLKIQWNLAKNFSKNKIAENHDPIINNDTMTNNDIQFRKLHHKTRLSFLPQKNEKQQQQ